MKFIYFCLILFFGTTASLSCQESVTPSPFRVAFYNVENLFDTKDKPIKKDEEFTPEGRKNWTMERFDKKLTDLRKVINSLENPAILGLCEVENKAVLQDLISKNTKLDVPYGIVHFESPDMRGIDAALLYNTDLFNLDSSSFIRVVFPSWLEPDGYTSRDIIYASLANKEGELFHIFVNHWPSRRGGEVASEKRRVWVASHLRRAVDGILSNAPQSKIIIMGDFNDEPSNNSISHALGTMAVDSSTFLLPTVLYNHFYTLEQQETGSYNYRGDWNMLDQIIVTGFDQTNKWTVSDFGVFNEDWLLYKGDKGASPNKTYGGSKYYGGFSDHLPVFMDFSIENR